MNKQSIRALASENDLNQFPTTSTPTQEDDEIQENTSTRDKIKALAEKNKKEDSEKFGFLDTIKDVGQQVLSKGISGIGGAYGNILDTFGLQNKEGETLPENEDLSAIKSQIIDKMNRGEAPSYGELMLLTDDDPLPRNARLPTSKDIQGGIEKYTGIGKGKTPAGRIAGHGAQFAGEGLALGGGGKALATLAGAGGAGQGLREAGINEVLASGTEILGSLSPAAITKKLAPSTKAGKDIVEAGRKIGLSEAQIAPLTHRETTTHALSKVARKGKKTTERFDSIKKGLNDSYSNIKANPKSQTKLPNGEQINLRKDFGQIRNDLSKTLQPSPDKQGAIDFIEKSLDTLRNIDVTPEHLVNFWQDINKAVKWNSLDGGKKALTQLKEPVLKVLKKASPQLAEDFENTNKLYAKYAQVSKKLRPEMVDSFVNKGEILGAVAGGIALATGNPAVLVGVGSEVALRILSREMLINPMFQNIANKLVTNINQGSVKAVTESVERAKKYLQKKHPNEDWSFLTNPKED